MRCHLKRIDETYDLGNIVIAHCLVAWQRQLLLMDRLRYWQRQRTPFDVCLLLVRRYWIMDGSVYPIVEEVLLQHSAIVTKYWEDMPDIIAESINGTGFLPVYSSGDGNLRVDNF